MAPHEAPRWRWPRALASSHRTRPTGTRRSRETMDPLRTAQLTCARSAVHRAYGRLCLRRADQSPGNRGVVPRRADARAVPGPGSGLQDVPAADAERARRRTDGERATAPREQGGEDEGMAGQDKVLLQLQRNG